MSPVGFNDDFFEERFKPAKPVFDEKTLKELNQGRVFTSKNAELRNLRFSEGLDPQTVHELKRLVRALLEYADLRGFRLRDANHPVFFTDIAGYEKESGTRLPENIPLPASRLDFLAVSKVYSITVILPEKLESSEVRINLTRSLFSKLFGEVHFLEHIQPLEFYRQQFNEELESSAGIPEILELLSTFEFPSERFQARLDKEASRFGFSLPKDSKALIMELNREWKRQWENRGLGEDEEFLKWIYRDFCQLLKDDPGRIQKQMIEQVKKLDEQLHLILPHDAKGYWNFESEQPLQFLRAYANRLQEMHSLLGFIEELEHQLGETEEVEILSGMLASLLLKMRDLRRDGKVRPYLMPEIKQNQEMINRASRFPLKMMKWLPVGCPIESWNEEFQKMKKQYNHSIYAKVYLALEAMEQKIRSKLKGDESTISENVDQRLKSMLAIFRFRSSLMDQWKTTLGILLDSSEVLPEEGNRQFISLDMIRKAWAYLLSAHITLEFYRHPAHLEFVPEGFQSSQYLRSIEHFIHKKTQEGINYYHLVLLLHLIHKESEDQSLEFLHFCLVHPLGTLHYLLQKTLVPLGENENLQNRLDQMPRHRDTLLYAYQKSWHEFLVENS